MPRTREMISREEFSKKLSSGIAGVTPQGMIPVILAAQVDLLLDIRDLLLDKKEE